MSDRFSADEARRIFARAARRQHAAPAADGLSLADLETIGREAGLDPALVLAEARAERVDKRPQQTWHGIPVGIRRSRVLPHRISDREWEQVVDLLRREFNLAGVSEQIGRRREWATAAGSSESMSSAYRVRIEERPEGDRVTIEAPNISRALGLILGGTFVGIGVLLAGLIGGLQPEQLGSALGLGALMAAFGGIAYVAALVGARLSAARTPSRLETLLDRIDLVSRQDEGVRLQVTDPAPMAEPARLDVDALDAASWSAAPRRRIRS